MNPMRLNISPCFFVIFLILPWFPHLRLDADEPSASTPGRLIFSSDFELGELEDPSRPKISAHNFLEKWQQQFAVPDRPTFMAGWVVRGAPQGERYLSLPLYSHASSRHCPRLLNPAKSVFPDKAD